MKNSFKKTKRKTAAGVLALMLALSMILGSVSVPVLAAQAAEETDITGTEFEVENETVTFPQDDFSSGIPEEETFAVEETRENAGEVITVTLDAGAEGYFIDENGVQVQTAATLWTAGSQVSELMTVLPAPLTDGSAVFAGWSFLEDGSELIPEEGFTAESDVTIYAVWNTGASDQDLLSAGDESGFEQAEVEGSGEDTWLPEGQNPETGSGEEISAGEVNGSGQPFGEGSFGEGGEEMWLPDGGEQAAGSGEEISAGAESGDGLTADGENTDFNDTDSAFEGENAELNNTDSAFEGENAELNNTDSAFDEENPELSGTDSAVDEGDGTQNPEDQEVSPDASEESGAEGQDQEDDAAASEETGLTDSVSGDMAESEEPAVEDVDPAQNTEAGIAAEAAIPNEVNSIEDAQTEDEMVLSEEGEQTEVSSDAAGTIEDEIPEQTEYTVTFDANGGAFEEGGQILQETVGKGRRIWFDDIEEPVKEGFAFLGWTTEKDNRDSLLEEGIRAEDNTTVYALWAEYKSITFDANDGYYITGRNPSTNGFWSASPAFRRWSAGSSPSAAAAITRC